MCGRFACTLGKQDLVRACTYRGNILVTEGNCPNGQEKMDSKLQECSKHEKDQELSEIDFGDEDDSFLLEASIPAVDAFTPRNHTAFHYAPFLGKKQEEIVEEEEDLKFEEEDESFLLEASINVESKSEIYSERHGVDIVPTWLEAPCGGMYKPSSNIPPTSYTPILYWQDNEDGPVIQPMLWGLVPPWHRGENPTSHGVSTNNARLEGVQSSKLYGPCLKRRCVVICDGFYEWRKNPSTTSKEKVNKQPFFVYRREEKEGQESLKDKSSRDLAEGEDFEGQKPLFMAGIYSVGEASDGRKVYSYSVLTREADSNLSWLHHRYNQEPNLPDQQRLTVVTISGCHVSSPPPNFTPG